MTADQERSRTGIDTRTLAPFAVLGTVGVVGGGLLAAVTAHATSRGTAWATAYLVLVVGVAQIALGAGQTLLSTRPIHRSVVVAESVLWNSGSAGVIAGTLLHVTVLVDAGGAMMLAALVLFARGVRRSGVGGSGARGWPVNLYRLLVGALLISVLVGVVLARTLP